MTGNLTARFRRWLALNQKERQMANSQQLDPSRLAHLHDLKVAAHRRSLAALEKVSVLTDAQPETEAERDEIKKSLIEAEGEYEAAREASASAATLYSNCKKAMETNDG